MDIAPAPAPALRTAVIRHGVHRFVLDGALVGAMCAVSDTWIVPLLTLCLGASGAMIGYLTIIPMLGVISFGLVARPVIRLMGGNKLTSLISVFTQAAMMVGLIIPLEFEFPGRLPMGMAMALIIVLCGAFGGPAWLAWMGDLVPRAMAGRLNAVRARIFQGVKVAFGIGLTAIFHRWPILGHPHVLAGVLAFGAVARAASGINIARIPVPAPRPPPRIARSEVGPTAIITFRDFINGLGRTTIGTWTLVWSVMVFGQTISAPFVAAYLVLGTDKSGMALQAAPYWLLVNIAVFTRMLSVPLIGRAIDLFGATGILRLGTLGVCLNVLPYIFTTRLPILYATEAFGGVSWCAVEIAMGVLLLSCNRDPLQRVRLIGFYQVVSGAAILLGALLGQTLLYQLSSGVLHRDSLLLHGNPYHTLFLISFVLRWPGAVLALVLLPRLRTLKAEETHGLWRLVPGLALSMRVSRSLAGVVRRAFG